MTTFCQNTEPASTPSPSEERLIPNARWNDFHPWPPEGGRRHLIANAEELGFSGVFVRCGRRILIREKKFWEAVERRNLERAINEKACSAAHERV